MNILFFEYPTDKIPGVTVKSGDAEIPGGDTDLDANPTGVEVDTDAYGKAYDVVPPEQNTVYQGDKLKVYGLGQQDLIIAPTESGNYLRVEEYPSSEPIDWKVDIVQELKNNLRLTHVGKICVLSYIPSYKG